MVCIGVACCAFDRQSRDGLRGVPFVPHLPLRIRPLTAIVCIALLPLMPALAHEPIHGLGPDMPARGLWGYEIELERLESDTELVQELSYGITPDVAVTVAVPYESSVGVGDAELRGKWRFLRRDVAGGSDQIAVIAALRHPVDEGSDGLRGLVALTGTRSFGKWYLWSDVQAAWRDPEERYAADVAVGWRPTLAEVDEIDINPVLELNALWLHRRAGRSDPLYISPGVLIAWRRYLVKFGVQQPVRNAEPDGVRMTAAFEVHF